jgi:ACR3 family arsenite transporter
MEQKMGNSTKQIGFFEKYLSLWVAICIAVGIGIGHLTETVYRY